MKLRDLFSIIVGAAIGAAILYSQSNGSGLKDAIGGAGVGAAFVALFFINWER